VNEEHSKIAVRWALRAAEHENLICTSYKLLLLCTHLHSLLLENRQQCLPEASVLGVGYFNCLLADGFKLHLKSDLYNIQGSHSEASYATS
jgi:hypothetical protein